MRWLIWVLDVLLVVNGAVMVAAPAWWYGIIPGVEDIGPLNLHFVRDIGAAYAVAGAGLLWFALRPPARPGAQAGAAFLALHAAVHLWDAAAGREHVHQLLVDTPTVLLPAALALWIAWPPRHRGATSMKEKSDDQMVPKKMARQVRAHVEL